MKSVGITGPQGAGKTTLWRATTGGHTRGEVAAVAVPDPRIDVLVDLHASRKRVPVQIELVDVHAAARSDAAATARLREMDALLVVVPAFGGQNAKAGLASMRDQLLLADMGPIETRLLRARKDPAAKHEVPALEAALDLLSEGSFLADRRWERGDLKVFSSLAPITLKPVVVVWNVDEDGLTADPPDSGGLPSFVASAALEAEVADLTPEEAAPLLEAFGVSEPVLGRVIAAVYRSLDLITFFTTGDDETRAWEVRRGAFAPEAAGAIHSDIQRGFIRAEVVGYDALVSAGSWDAAKEAGQLRVEGKEYVMAEGDVVHFRFNI
jgi:ribosome-binding ATPase YchF (GTP1/OBG family)